MQIQNKRLTRLDIRTWLLVHYASVDGDDILNVYKYFIKNNY